MIRGVILGIILFLFLPLTNKRAHDRSELIHLEGSAPVELRSGWIGYDGFLLFEGNSSSSDCFYSKKENRFLDPSCNFTVNENHPLLQKKEGTSITIPYSWKENPESKEKSNIGYLFPPNEPHPNFFQISLLLPMV